MTTNDKTPFTRRPIRKGKDADKQTEGREIKPARGGGKSWRNLIEEN